MIIVNLSSTFIFLLVNVYFYINFKDKAFLAWMTALCSFLIVYFTQFFNNSENPLIFLFVIRQLMFISGSSFILLGTIYFVKRSILKKYFISPGLATIWLIVGTVYFSNLNLISIPIFILLAWNLILGVLELQKFYSNGFELEISIVITFLWALNYLLFPILNLYKENWAIFDSVNSLCTIFHGIGIILMHSRRKSEELLKESSRLIMTMNHLSDGLLILNTDFQIALMNQKAEILIGIRFSDAKSSTLEEIYRTTYRNETVTPTKYFENILSRRTKSQNRECVLLSKNGQKRIISESINLTYNHREEVTGFIILIRDITEASYFEEESIISRNLESISTLAAGIAHDFNNILTTIIGNISIIKYDNLIDADNEDLVDDMESAAFRAKKLANQYLSFAEGGDPIKTEVDLEKILTVLISKLTKGIQISYDLQFKVDTWPLKFDRNQMEHAISNIIQNAIEAMPQGGLLTISTANIAIPNNSDFGLVPDNYVQISIQDTGIGIKKGNIVKIFDPYYTTKPHRKGIGLPLTYSIIKKHNGNIKVNSVLGEGSMFTLYLPALTD